MDPRLSFLLVCFLASSLVVGEARSAETKSIRAGIIGLDTSHVVAFTKTFNDPRNDSDDARRDLAGVKVVAAYPGGSPDIPSSIDRVPGYTKELSGMGVEIVDSIDTLLGMVDAVLLESLDGRPHLEQARPVF